LQRRRLRYLLRYHVWRAPLAWLHCLYRRGFRTSVKARVESIGLVDMSLDDSDDEAFVRATTDALALIQRLAPRRYRTILRETAFIVNAELTSGACYNRYTRSIGVDFPRYRVYPEADDYGWHLARYAAVLVHEATHGRLESRWFPYTKGTRAQIERICHAEQSRFLARWSAGRFDLAELVPPFDETRWHRHWYGGILRRTRDILRRIRGSHGGYARGRNH
jgi:hypothetical protein